MRLERFELDGYGGLRQMVLAPGALTVLVGAEASSAFEAFGLLSMMAKGWSRLSEGVDAAMARAPWAEGEIRWGLQLAPPEESNLGLVVETVVERYDGGWEVIFERVSLANDFDDIEVVGRQGSKASYIHPRPGGGLNVGRKVERFTMPMDMSVLGALAPLERDARTKEYLSVIASYGAYRPTTMGVRVDTSYGTYATRLADDGENLQHVLYDLDDREGGRERLVAALRAAMPEAEGVSFTFNDAGEMSFRVKLGEGKSLAMSELPEAAWQRLLTYAAVSMPDPPRVVWIDRLGDGLDVGEAEGLVAAVRGLSERCQVILSSPSPAVARWLAEGPPVAVFGLETAEVGGGSLTALGVEVLRGLSDGGANGVESPATET